MSKKIEEVEEVEALHPSAEDAALAKGDDDALEKMERIICPLERTASLMTAADMRLSNSVVSS